MITDTIKSMAREDYLVNLKSPTHISEKYQIERRTLYRILHPEKAADQRVTESIKRMYASGMKLAEISRRTGQTDYRVRRDLGLWKAPKPLTKSAYAAAKRRMKQRYHSDPEYRQRAITSTIRSAAKRHLMMQGFTEEQAVFTLNRKAS